MLNRLIIVIGAVLSGTYMFMTIATPQVVQLATGS